MAKKIIEIQNVSKSFGGKNVLKDINLYTLYGGHYLRLDRQSVSECRNTPLEGILRPFFVTIC